MRRASRPGDLRADAARALRGEPGGGHLCTARVVEALADHDERDERDQASEAPPNTVTVADDRLISSYWDGWHEGVVRRLAAQESPQESPGA